MNLTPSLSGIWSALVTPVDGDYEPDASRAIGLCRDLLHEGCDGINLLGTTGEAMSFGCGQRRRLMEAVATSGLPLERIMVGTGAAALADAAELLRCASELGFAAALVMPPFFYREPSDDGVLRYFAALFARAKTSIRVLLYNFPKMSGTTFHPALVDRLLDEFPERIAGMKDSSNDRALQAEILRRHPSLAVFPGAEDYLIEARAYGASGCISGSVCLWPWLAQEVLRDGSTARAEQLAAQRRALPQPLIATVRARLAQRYDDDTWLRSIPPL